MNFKLPPKAIIRFLESNSIKYLETSDPNEIRINSVFDNDNKFKLYISLDKGLFHCFKSGEGGKVEKLFSNIVNINEGDILNHLIKNYFNKGDIKEEIIVEKTKELELPKDLKFFRDTKSSSMILDGRKKAYNYLARRGIKEEVINELGYITNSDEMYNDRIFIPFFEEKKLVYFQTRDFTGYSKMRYINPKGFTSKEFIFNADKIRDSVVIVEGLFDALSIDNIPATAIMSADLTLSQAKKIMWKAPKEIIIIPDNDETGTRTLSKNIEMLNYVKPKSLNYSIWIYYIPKEFKDFNEFAVKSNNFQIDKTKLIRYNKNRFIGDFKISSSIKNLI